MGLDGSITRLEAVGAGIGAGWTFEDIKMRQGKVAAVTTCGENGKDSCMTIDSRVCNFALKTANAKSFDDLRTKISGCEFMHDHFNLSLLNEKVNPAALSRINALLAKGGMGKRSWDSTANAANVVSETWNAISSFCGKLEFVPEKVAPEPKAMPHEDEVDEG